MIRCHAPDFSFTLMLQMISGLTPLVVLFHFNILRRFRGYAPEYTVKSAPDIIVGICEFEYSRIREFAN